MHTNIPKSSKWLSCVDRYLVNGCDDLASHSTARTVLLLILKNSTEAHISKNEELSVDEALFLGYNELWVQRDRTRLSRFVAYGIHDAYVM